MDETTSVVQLAIELYKDLPTRTRRKTFKWFLKRGWDVTHNWEHCLYVAHCMMGETTKTTD